MAEVQIAFEERCRRCDGGGVVYASGKEDDCPQCSGSGWMPTELGDDLIAFLRRHFDLKPKK